MAKEQMAIFIDANQIIGQGYFLGSNLLTIFRNYLKGNDGVKLHVPQVALDEAAKHFVEELSNKNKLLIPILQRLNRGSTPGQAFQSPQDFLPWYREFLLSELREVGAEIMGYPDVSHGELISRYISNRKPFGSKKGDCGGYKDSLIWENIIKVVRGSPPTIDTCISKVPS